MGEDNWFDDEVEVLDERRKAPRPQRSVEDAGRAWFSVPPLATPDVEDWFASAAEREAGQPTWHATGTVTVDTDARIADMTQEAAAAAQARRRRRRRSRIVLSVAAGALVVVGVTVGVVSVRSGPNGSDTASTPVVVAAPSSSTAEAEPSPRQVVADEAEASKCPTVNERGRVSGNGPGDTTTAIGEIFYSQYQMYVARNADAARTVFAPGAAVAAPDATRAAIDALPVGITHCVHILTLSPTEYAVTVDEHHPSGRTQSWDNRITVAPQPDGRPLIAAINPAPTG